MSAPRDEVHAFFAALAPNVRPDAPVAPATSACDDLLACTLHDYQRQAVAWAVKRERGGPDAHGVRGGVLAEEMGLGKTIEVLALLVENASCATLTTPVSKHPLYGGQLMRGTASGRFAGSTCASCARKFAPHEPIHHAALDAWACCQWCFLPHQSELSDNPASVPDAAPDGAAEPDASPAERRVRFATALPESMRPMRVVGAASLASARRESLDASLGLVAGSPVRLVPRPAVGPPTGFRIRIKRPREAASSPNPPCAATLVVTPASILRQWLSEIERHAPALAPRVLVYPGAHVLLKHMQPSQLSRALDRACIILTTYRVLSKEVHHRGGRDDDEEGVTAAGRRVSGGSLRKKKRYEVPESPLLVRCFHRLVIDEAQAVQSKTATPSQIAQMARRIEATHRWCVTGTPLSEERGLVDGFDLLSFLGATAPLAASKRAFAAALADEHNRAALLALLREVTWRASKAFAYAQLRIPAPLSHQLTITLSSAELAWASRDVRELGGSAAAELPPPPLGPTPPAQRHDADADASSAAAACGAHAVPPRFELQRALSHVQLGRSWVGLGRSEAQLETGTSIVDLEQLSRAAELLMRRKQLLELELCERLNTCGSWLCTLGEPEAARERYERVLRIEEWGIGEDESAGHQEDNSVETLRRWQLEKCHTLFRLTCLHYNAGRNDEASDASDQLRVTEEEARDEAESSVATFPRLLRREATSLCGLLAAIILIENGQQPRAIGTGHGEASGALGWAANLEIAPCTPVDGWLERAAESAHTAVDGGTLAPGANWLLEVERLAHRLRTARTTALQELRSAGEGGEGGEGGGEGRVEGGGGALEAAVMEEESEEEGEEEGGEPAEADEAAQRAAAAEPARGRAAARARGAGVIDFWDVSALEHERRERQKGATAREYAALRANCGIIDSLRLRRLEVVAQVESEAEVMREEWFRVRREREAASRDAAAASGDGPANAEAEAAAVRVHHLRLWCDLLRQSEHELGVRSQWALSRAACESGDDRRELSKAPKALPERVEALPEDQQHTALRAELGTLEAACKLQTCACLDLEDEIKMIYEQRMRECNADRAAQRSGRAACSLTSPRFALWSADGLHDLLSPLAPHTCAVTLALRIGLAQWLRRQRDEAVPAGSFSFESALLGSRPEQLRWKLDAVRWCASRAGLRLDRGGNELVAAWMLREIPECLVVPCAILHNESEALRLAQGGAGGADGAGGAASTAAAAAPLVNQNGEVQAQRPRWSLPDGTAVDCVVDLEDEKERIYDGRALVEGQHDGQVSGASYEPGPWTWVAERRQWVRDAFPHDVLVVTPCGHAYSERYWSEIMSTQIERASTHTFRARKARCCAPLVGGVTCGKVLSEAQALRVTGCRPRMPRYTTAPCTATATRPAPSHLHTAGVPLHGSWGSRVDTVVRLLLALRASAADLGDAAAAKAVIFSRHEPLLKLLATACAMNGVRAARFGLGGQQHNELADFVSDKTIQALLLSAQRDASGLTLTAASHVIIVEPQPEVAIEQQMVGRVHRIGQTRQTHVHRLVVGGSFEADLAAERSVVLASPVAGKSTE